jgi:rhodanese-related sulfurtransferase
MPTHVERERLSDLVKHGAQLVEVLPAAEYDEEHLPGAINIPLKEIDRRAPERLERNTPVIVYCWDFT